MTCIFRMYSTLTPSDFYAMYMYVMYMYWYMVHLYLGHQFTCTSISFLFMLHALVCRVLVYSCLLLVFPKKLGFKNRRKVTSVQDVRPRRLACMYVSFKLLAEAVSLLLVFLALALALVELVQGRPGWIESIRSGW